jgi:5-methylcytosine-specific restriction protein A
MVLVSIKKELSLRKIITKISPHSHINTSKKEIFIMGILQTVLTNARVAAPKKVRSSKWPAVRKAHLKAHPFCAACGQKTVLEVHHIVPFSDNPALELDPTNLITLCESAKGGIICHMYLGHRGNYQDENPNIVEDAKRTYTFLNAI